jgi:hypothetical protein
LKIHIDPEVRPVAQGPRRIPFGLRREVEDNLTELVNIIEKADGPTPVFQHIIQKILQGCEGVQNIADDIVVHGSTIELRDRRLSNVLDYKKKNLL